jgi:fatty-acyl-CoA synthase
MLTTRDMVRRNRYRWADQLAVADEHQSVTHRDFTDRCWSLARGLIAKGVKPGDTVGIMAGNGVFSAEAYVGATVAGGIAVPFNWRSATPELVHQINDSTVRIVLAEEDWRPALSAAEEKGLVLEPDIYYLGEEYESLLLPGEGEPEVDVGPEDGNVIIYTGGTTGESKGVLLSHRNVFSNCVNEINDTDMVRDDRTLLTTPMYHAAALLCWFLPHLLLGAASIFTRSFDEDTVAARVESESVTNMFMVPNMLRRMLLSGAFGRFDWSSFQRMYVGGSTFTMEDKLGARESLPEIRIYYQYGLSEGGPIVTRLRPEDMFRADIDGSIGKEFLLSEVSIRNEDGEEVPRGEPGEMWIKGPGLMVGYFNRPEATAAAFQDGWLRSGDVAIRGADDFLFFHDRIKDMIKTGGANVYSAEVEQILQTHPGVVEAAVIGVSSQEWDEEVRAVVAPRPDHTVTEAELQGYCREFLAGYKIPKRIAVIDLDELPINPSGGKIMKRELRGRDLWAGDAGGESEPSR